MARQRQTQVPIFLSEEDLAVLREMSEWFRQRVNNTSGRQRDVVQEQEQPAPETYLAWAYEGIPAAVSYREDAIFGTGTGSGTGTSFYPEIDVIPSPGEADVYRMVDGSPRRIGRAQTVLNPSLLAIAAGTLLLVQRDKFGTWFAVRTEAGKAAPASSSTTPTLVKVYNAGALVGQEPGINLSGGAVTSVTDDPPHGYVTIVLTSAGFSVGAFDSQPKDAKGAVLTSNVLYFQSADRTGAGAGHPGMVNLASQDFIGTKRFHTDGSGDQFFVDGFVGVVAEGGLVATSAFPHSAASASSIAMIALSSGGALIDNRLVNSLGTQNQTLQIQFEPESFGAGWHFLFAASTSSGSGAASTVLAVNEGGAVRRGQYGTDPIGNVFSGGLCTHVSTSASIPPGTGTGVLVGSISPTIASPIITDAKINQAANGDTAISSKRATDTAPTGNFEDFQTQAGVSLWTVDVTGTLIAGTVPVARISGFSSALDALGGITATF